MSASEDEFDAWWSSHLEFDPCEIGTAYSAWQARQPEIDALRARVAELEGNDRRYRWLRDDHKGTSPHMDGTMVWIRTGRNVLRGQTLDSAIDKAMGKPKSEAPPAPMVPEVKS